MSWLNPAEVNGGGEGIDGSADVEFYVPQDDQVPATTLEQMANPSLDRMRCFCRGGRTG